jgi:TonB-dependent receptor
MTGAEPAAQEREFMRGFKLSKTLVRSTSAVAIATCLVLPGAALAQSGAGIDNQGATATDAQPGPQPGVGVAQQDAPAGSAQDIVVTGIRASLSRAQDIKRNSAGVVDAISSEDIGKFPDTNLAESLQRITGVSINRVNGEGAQVTVRGFGPSYNLVTLNGRTLASSSITVVGGDGGADGAQGTTRTFDFNNLSSEGVKTLEVYKTARAAIPSGGIGAAINIVTRKPLDTGTESGLTGSIGAKAVYDTSVKECISCGDDVTPEVSGFVNWSNPDQTFGVSLFGSYQKRNFSTVQTGGNAWNTVPYSTFLGYTNASTVINNAPTDPDTLVGVPNDSRSDFSELNRERINGQAVIQWAPTDTVMLTIDGLYAQNKQRERRTDSSNWFNRPFDEVTFDGNDVINSAVYLHETLSPTKDGPGSENQYRATKSKLEDYGANLKWELTDNFTITADGHYSKAQTLPDNPNGATSTLVAFAGYGISSHSVDYSSGYPVMQFDFDDTAADGSNRQGNRNGVMDVGDLGAQQNRQFFTRQTQRLKEGRVEAGWDLGEGSRLDFGGNYRTSNMHSTQISTQQTLGDWGVANPGDIERFAPGLVQEFCLPCKFSNIDLQATGNALKAFRTQDATALYNALLAGYSSAPVAVNGNNNNRVKEDIWAGYAQLTWKGTIASRPASLVAGVRYERTKSKSVTLQVVPQAIRWDADNDFFTILSDQPEEVSGKHTYNNLLPAMDFQIELIDNLVGRVSFGRTIARTDYSNLFALTTAGGPNRPTAIGGVPTANSGNPMLNPLTSDNFDVSLEYYYKPGSFVSVGLFEKRVNNFVGNGITTSNLFGLRDPTSGAPGSRSGNARTALQTIGADISDVNLFTMTALIDQRGSVDAATAEFQANRAPGGALQQAFVDTILTAYNVTGDANDPLYEFSLSQPINNNDAKIWGFEVAATHFFGDTGIGIAAAYTYVRGNIGIDRGADPDVDQFALLGLSDTANVTLIYDKNGLSGRLAYNWRDKFLAATNIDNYHNPRFTRAFGQLDLNISYDITPNIAVSLEAINLTEEGVRQYIRTPAQLIFAQELQRRFLAGVRYRF